MKIQKVISNNVLWIINEQGNEVIVTGNGIGFQKSKGDIVEQGKIEKTFALSGGNMSQFEQLVKNIPLEKKHWR